MGNYWVIPMDYETYDFGKMQAEYLKHNKEILWETPGTPEFDKNTNIWKKPKDLFYANHIERDDTIYFYVYNIESQSGNKKARILLKGVVTKEPSPMEKGIIYGTNDSSLTIGFSIGQIRTLTKRELENDFCYSRELLDARYQQIWPQGRRWPNTHSGNLSQSLIEALDNSFKQSGVERDFVTLIQHFNRKCFFCDKLGRPSDHKTFKRRGRGTDYFEGHHFIPEHTKRQIPALTSIVDDEDNYVWLCSNCHNQLHYGRIEDASKMIDLLWNDQRIRSMLRRKNLAQILLNAGLISEDTEEQALAWLKTVYKSSDKNPHKF